MFPHTYPQSIVSSRTRVIITKDKESQSTKTIVGGDHYSGSGVGNVLTVVEKGIGVSLDGGGGERRERRG